MQSSTEQLILQLKALADSARMRLVALCGKGECSVSELTAVLGISQPRVSQHLKQLCDAGLLERFRDGQRMYYRLPVNARSSAVQELVPADDPLFVEDERRLRSSRGEDIAGATPEITDERIDRVIHREIVKLTVTDPLGTVLDVGCGRGKLIKLLSSRANRIVGVDIDAGARELARAELMLAGIPNCSLRQGDMYRLPFEDASFDTVILDEVLADAERPVDVLIEAGRQLKPGGRLVVVQSVTAASARSMQQSIADWSADARLRLAPARLVPKNNPSWLLSVATLAIRASRGSAAA